jgi:shikimate dehydrogenase
LARALVLGTGGAARAAIVALASRLGVAEVVVRGRSFSHETARARFERDLCDSWRSPCAARLRLEPWTPSSSTERDATIVVQATSVGMVGADPGDVAAGAVDWGALPGSAVALDAVYSPEATPFVAAATARGLHARNGLGWLARQGALALQLWLATPAPYDVMLEALLRNAR